MLKCCYREYCTIQGSVVLGKEERNALAKYHEWESSGENGEVFEIGNELEDGED